MSGKLNRVYAFGVFNIVFYQKNMRELVAQLVRASLWTLDVWGVAGINPACPVLVISYIYLVLYEFALFYSVHQFSTQVSNILLWKREE